MEETRKPVLVELANMLANSWRDPLLVSVLRGCKWGASEGCAM